MVTAIVQPNDDLLIVEAHAEQLQEIEEVVAQLKVIGHGSDTKGGRGGRYGVKAVGTNTLQIEAALEHATVELKVGDNLKEVRRGERRKRGANHEDEGVGAQTTRVGVVEGVAMEVLLEDDRQRAEGRVEAQQVTNKRLASRSGQAGVLLSREEVRKERRRTEADVGEGDVDGDVGLGEELDYGDGGGLDHLNRPWAQPRLLLEDLGKRVEARLDLGRVGGGQEDGQVDVRGGNGKGNGVGTVKVRLQESEEGRKGG